MRMDQTASGYHSDIETDGASSAFHQPGIYSTDKGVSPIAQVQHAQGILQSGSLRMPDSPGPGPSSQGNATESTDSDGSPVHRYNHDIGDGDTTDLHVQSGRMVVPKGKLKPADYKKIQDNFTYLLEQIEANDLTDFLFQENVLSCDDDVEEIRSLPSKSKRARALLTRLLNAGPEGYGKFLQALKVCGYSTVAEKLEGPASSGAGVDQLSPGTSCMDATEKNIKVKRAASEGEIEIVHTILNGDAPICDQVVYDMLSNASAHDQIHIVQYILSRGYHPDGLDSSLRTSLYRACLSSSLKIVKILIDNGADVNKKVKGKESPLAIACHLGKLDLIELLIKKGASLNHRTSQSHTPLSLAVSQKRINVCCLLLRYKAPVDERIDGGFSPLMLSARQGETEIADLLLAAGASVNTKNDQGFSSLILASEMGHTKFVQFLLDRQLSSDCINVRDKKGFSALMSAAKNGHLEIVKLLLPHMGGAFSSTQTGESVLMLAVKGGHKHIVEYLLDHGEIPVNHANHRGITALYLSAQSGSKEISDLLLRYGAAVDQRTLGVTPLMVASSRGNCAVVKLLVDRGAELEVDGGNGCTALVYAVSEGQHNIVNILLEAGASVTHVAKQSAEISGHSAILNSLKEYDRRYQKLNMEYSEMSSFSQDITKGSINSLATGIVEEPAEDLSYLPTNLTAGARTTTDLSLIANNTQPIPVKEETFEDNFRLLSTNTASSTDSPPSIATQPVFYVTEKNTGAGISVPSNTSNSTNININQPMLPVKEKHIDAFTDLSANAAAVTDICHNVNIMQPSLGVKATQTEVAETDLSSGSNITSATGAISRGTSLNDINTSAARDVAVVRHSASVPAELEQLLKNLPSGPHTINLINYSHNDNRQITINDSETVGVGPVNISHNSYYKSEGSQHGTDMDGGEEDM